MNSLSEYATERYPIRASALNWMTRCVGGCLLQDANFIDLLEEGPSSTAAATGSAVDKAIEFWHQGMAVDEALAKIRQVGRGSNPKRPFDVDLVDIPMLERMFGGYAADPRNSPAVSGVQVDSIQETVTARLQPSSFDPTGRPIVIVGHLDQVRRDEEGVYRVWDLKSGKDGGPHMVMSHAWQLAAYTVGYAQSHTDREVQPGGVIRLRGYCSRAALAPGEHDVFHSAPWSLEGCHTLLDSVVEIVAQIRGGLIMTTPSIACNWCVGINPATCVDKFPTTYPVS